MANPAFYYSNHLLATVAAGRRRAGGPDVLVRRESVDRRLETERALLLCLAADSLVPVPAGSGERERSRASQPAEPSVGSSFTLSRDGSQDRVSRIGCPLGSGGVRRAGDDGESQKLTDMNAQTAGFTTSTLEVVSWKSQDGATIEGVLHKPADFDPSRKYPLLIVIHGGPDRRLARDPVHQRHLSDRRLGAARRSRARAELPRQRRLRREVPRAERPEPRRRRRLGRAVRHRLARREGPGRSRPGRHDGLEPGRLHLRVPRDARRARGSRPSRSAPASPTG